MIAYNWREHIMQKPPEDRLDVAIFLLEELTGRDLDKPIAAMLAYGLTPQEALIVTALNAAAPRIMTKEQLFTVLYGDNDGREIKIVDVLICKARAKLPPGTIQTVWGTGYFMRENLPIELGAPPAITNPFNRRKLEAKIIGGKVIGQPWTPEDDAELLRMRSNGSDWWAIADCLGRTERGCAERHRTLGRANGGH